MEERNGISLLLDKKAVINRNIEFPLLRPLSGAMETGLNTNTTHSKLVIIYPVPSYIEINCIGPKLSK